MHFDAFTWHVPSSAFLEHACTLFLFTIFLFVLSKVVFCSMFGQVLSLFKHKMLCATMCHVHGFHLA